MYFQTDQIRFFQRTCLHGAVLLWLGLAANVCSHGNIASDTHALMAPRSQKRSGTLMRWVSTSSTVATLMRPGLLLSTASSFIWGWKPWAARWRPQEVLLGKKREREKDETSQVCTVHTFMSYKLLTDSYNRAALDQASRLQLADCSATWIWLRLDQPLLFSVRAQPYEASAC